MTWVESATNDLRHSLRSVARMPGLAAVVILSLGIGIGVNTVIFSWIQALVFQPLPGVRDSANFLLIEPRTETGSYPGVSWLEYRDLRERVPAVRDLIATRMATINLGQAPRTERSFAQLVSGNFFTALGLRPALGRFLLPDEVSRPGGEPVVVISYEFWQNRLGGASTALGQTLRLNDCELTIVGVTPRGFQGSVIGLHYDLWAPATLMPLLFPGSTELEDRSQRGYSAIGILAPGSTRARAQAEFDAALRDLARLYPDTSSKLTGEVLPFWSSPRGPQRLLVRGLALLQGIMVLLLLAVCGNTANLVIARASARYKEMGVRLALGAGPWRIVRLLLTENLLLALFAAALGAMLAAWGTQALRAAPLTGAFPIRFETHVDAAGLAFAILLGVASGLLFGLGPAARMARIDPQLALHTASNTPPRRRVRHALMGIEVALALVVLMAAALFLRSFQESQETDPGFRRQGVLLAAYDLTTRNADAATSRIFASRLLKRLRALPNVDAAAISLSVPLDIHGLPSLPFTLEGRANTSAAPDRALANTVTPGYFATLDIPLVAGTDFADLNDAAAPPQVIVNDEFVRHYLAGGEPLGRRLESRGRSYVIAGVARTTMYDSFGEPPTPIIYFSYRDRSWPVGEIHLRTRPGAEASLTPSVEGVVRDLDPTLPLYDVRTMSEHIEKSLFLRRIPARMFAFLGPLLLLLASIGIYAVVANSVAHRTTEIGVRLALGATPRRVVRQIVRESMGVIVQGAAVGWLLGLGIYMHALRGGPMRLSVFAGVPAILLGVALLACWLPAQRAAHLDPVAALRQE